MKPLFSIVVAILVVAATAHSENVEGVKELSQSKEPLVEAEGSEPQARKERCTTCSHSLKSQNELFQALKSIPNAEVHTQETFEGCNSEKGCAGIKKVDGAVVEKFGNLQALNGAPSAGANTPFWWMNQANSPFKAGAAGGGSFEKFSKSSSSFTSSSSNGGAGGVDLAGNPFLNGDFAKLGAGFNGASSNFGSSQSEIDITKNQFLNGQSGFAGQSGGAFGSGSKAPFGSQSASAFGNGGQAAFGSKAQGFGANSQSGFGASGSGVALSQGAQNGFGSQSGYNSFNAAGKFGSGYTGSSPAPFSPTGSNVNLIQNAQKNEFDYQQQQQSQQNIDEVFQSTGNVQAHESSGGDLQQTCAGQGYVCVLKSQCNNGVVNTNGGGLLQANTQKQYCNTRTEICCRIETASLAGAGNLQGSLGVGSATYNGNQQGLFSQSGSASNQNSFGATGFGNQATNSAFGSVNRGSSGFGSNQFGASGSSFGSNKFASTTGTGFGSTIAPNRNVNEVFKSTSQSNFVETDSFSSGSDNSGIYRPGAVGTVLKPGIPYLPPVDASSSGSNVVSTAYTPAFVTTPRPFTTPRPITTQRVYSTPKPTYLPPVSTKAPEYLPPVDGYTASDSFPHPTYIDGQLILDENLPGPVRPPPPPVVFKDVPSACAAALKCTPVEFCSADGVISNTTVVLTRDQEIYRVPLTDCKDLSSGLIGKCCRDPFYTDPWPVNQLGKWINNAFGPNGSYVPDNRGSPNNPPRVTVRPPTTGTIREDFYPETTPTPNYYQGTSTYQGGQGTFASNGQNAFASNVGKTAFSQGTGLTSFSNQNTNAFSSGAQNGFGQNAISRGSQNGLGFSTAQNTNTLSRGTGITQGTLNTNAFSRGTQNTQNSLNGFSQGGLNTNTLARGGQSGISSVSGFNQGQNTNTLSRGVQNSLTGISQGAQNTNAFARGSQNSLSGFSGGAQNTNAFTRGQTGLTGLSGGTQTNAFQGSQSGLAGSSLGVQNTNAFSRGAQSGSTGFSGAGQTNAFGQGGQTNLAGSSLGVQNTNAFSRGAQSGSAGFSGGAQTNAFGQGGQAGLAGSSLGVQNANAFSRGAQSGSAGFSGSAQNGLGFSGGAAGGGLSGGAQSGGGFAAGAQSGGFSGGAQNSNAFSRGAQSGAAGFSGGAQSGGGFSGGAQSGGGFSGGAQGGSGGFSGGAQGGSAGLGFSGGAQSGGGFAGGAQSGGGFSGGAQSGRGFSAGAQNGNGFSRGGQSGLGFAQGAQSGNAFNQGAQNAFATNGLGAFSGGAQIGFGQGAQRLTSKVEENASESKKEKIIEVGGFGKRRTDGFIVEKGIRTETEQDRYRERQTGGFIVEKGIRTETEQDRYGKKQTGGFIVEKGIRTETEQDRFGKKETGGFKVEKGIRTETEGGNVYITEGERYRINQGKKQNGIEYETSESTQRVFLKRYQGKGDCGLQNPQRPYGNHKDLELDFAEIPWQAMILLQTNRSLLCGGVITRPDVVITSASCVEGLDAKNVLIKGGEWKLGIDDEPLPFQIVQVKHILRHPLYEAGSLKNDAAILVLNEDLRLAKNIWPICLPSLTDTFDAFYNGAGKCIVTGWGKSVLQAHLEGSIIHGMNVSLLNPGQCENKISQDYPHLRDQYDQESCACGQPTNPANNICKVDIGSAVACTTDDIHYVLRGIYSWDSGCQVGNQLIGFYKFDLEWYEWAIGLIESVRFSQYTLTTVTKKQFGVPGISGVKGVTTITKTVTSGFQPGQTITDFGLTGSQGATKTTGTTVTTVTNKKIISGVPTVNTGIYGVRDFGIQGITGGSKTSDLQGTVTTVTNKKIISGVPTVNTGIYGVRDFGIQGITGGSKTSDLQGTVTTVTNKKIISGGPAVNTGIYGGRDFGTVTTVKKIITTEGSGVNTGLFGNRDSGLQNTGIKNTVTGFNTGGAKTGGSVSTVTNQKFVTTGVSGINTGLFGGNSGVSGSGFQQTNTGGFSQFGTTKFTGGYQEIKGPIEETFTTYTKEFVGPTQVFTTKPVTKVQEFTKIIPLPVKTEYVKLEPKRFVVETRKPAEIRYVTSGSQTNQQIVAPNVSFTPSFSEITGAKHVHDAKCKCLENGKK